MKIINKKYSFRDFSNKSFLDIPVIEFNNTIIKGSCFYQENYPNKDIFPSGMVGVVFDNVNLDNVHIDKSNNIILDSCTNKKIQVQNDWDDWILDNNFKPIEPINKKQRLKAGISIKPEDIPKEKFTEEERLEFKKSLTEEK